MKLRFSPNFPNFGICLRVLHPTLLNDYRCRHTLPLAKQIAFKIAPRKVDEMKTETKSMHITPSGGNVFTDLGFDACTATKLEAASDRRISEKLATNSSLKAGPAETGRPQPGDINNP